jgi:hypothetical protein
MCFLSSRSHLLNFINMLLPQLNFLPLFSLASATLSFWLLDDCWCGCCDGHYVLDKFYLLFSCGLLLRCLHRKDVWLAHRDHLSRCYLFKFLKIIELVTLSCRLLSRYQFKLLLSIKSLLFLALLVRGPNLLSDSTLNIHVVSRLSQLHRISFQLPLLVVEWVVCIALKLVFPIKRHLVQSQQTVLLQGWGRFDLAYSEHSCFLTVVRLLLCQL